MSDEIYPEPECDVSREDLAWAVGLFEGEGCLTISCDRRSGWKQARAKLNSTDRDVVLRFARIVGLGQVRGERSQEKRGWKAQWEWFLSAREDVYEFIQLVWPLLGQRRSLKAIDLLSLIESQRQTALASADVAA